MNTKSFSLVVGILLVLFSVGCSKKEEVQHPASTAPSFEEQLLTVLPLMDDQHLIQVQMTITASGHSTPVFIIRPLTDGAIGSKAGICRGPKGEFVRCVGTWQNDHPGKCLRIYPQAGTYAADEGC